MAFQIGKYIKFALSSDRTPELNAIVGERIYPVVVPDDDLNNAPYIWYNVEETIEEYCKDGRTQDTDYVSVNVVAKSYGQLVEILGLVRQAVCQSFLDWNDTDNPPFFIADCVMSAKEEEFDPTDDTYQRAIIFKIENR